MIEEKLESLGVKLPNPPTPAGSYVPAIKTGNLLFISGQIPMEEGKVLFTGKVNDDNLETAQKSARMCAINLLAQVKAACGGDLDRLVRVVKLGGFVNSTSDFTDQPKVINGCSDFMVEALGDLGRHARSAVSCPSLPLGVAVEIDGVFQIK